MECIFIRTRLEVEEYSRKIINYQWYLSYIFSHGYLHRRGESPTQSAIESSEARQGRRKRHGLLNLYYGLNAPVKKPASTNPMDIDGESFNAEMYMSKTVEEVLFPHSSQRYR